MLNGLWLNYLTKFNLSQKIWNVGMRDELKLYTWQTNLESICLDNAAVVVLNTKITNPPSIVQHLWNKCKLRVTVDGGTNRWHQFAIDNHLEYKIPDLITGDFDSIIPNVLDKFVKLGSKTIHTPNQNETDFTKALKEIKKYTTDNNTNINTVIVMVNMDIRIDHFLSNINTLYKLKDQFSNIDVFLLGRNTLTWLLLKGNHRIHIPPTLRMFPEKNYIGIFPLGSACNHCTTNGLKWNINGKMEMGGLISSSNTNNGDSIIMVTNSSPILWTMTLGFEYNF
ncbi:thiamin pyrophosphokinase 1 [Daktulosphaira vitifoliae]|uniref:thiamin pyrophosphokinase 1 n=1 Tax=Daktulosphaira vitifoliae TaxID=58002 RepID=UPI0021AA8E15|nr:thiamin pyrophosphokinase 1 [Daktulosphaira vitifoliae]